MTLPTQNLVPLPQLQFFDANGVPLAGGTVTTYAADGSTAKATYQNPAGSTINANPIVLDSAGRASIWGTGPYVFKVEDSLGNIQYTSPTQEPTYWLGISSFSESLLPLTTAGAWRTALGAAASGSAVPIGCLLAFAGSSIPTQWLLCYGQAISRTTYSALFAVIGTTFGAGNGSTTFNIPDMRGRVPAGADNMGGSYAGNLTSATIYSGTPGTGVGAVLGVTGGNEAPQDHSHTITDPTHNHAILNEVISYTAGSNVAFSPASSGASYGTNFASTGITINTQFTGQSGNVQPVAITNYIIFAGA